MPWDRPEIWVRSEKLCGWASISIWRTNGVPSSGMPKVPVWLSMSSGLTPSASVDTSKLMTFLSFIGTLSIEMPVNSSR